MKRTDAQRKRDAEKWREAQQRAARKYADKQRERARLMQTPGTGPPGEKAFARRSKPLNRHAANTARSKAGKAKRNAAEWARAFGSKERVQAVKAMPCCVSVHLGIPQVEPTENAHVGSHVEAGMGRRGDACTIAPLAGGLHRRQEGRTAAFEREMGLSEGFLMAAAAHVESLYPTK